MNELLRTFAENVLAEIQPKKWDSMGYQLYGAMCARTEASEEERLEVWKAGIERHHKEWTYKYRQYLKHGGMYAHTSPDESKAREEKEFSKDMKAWDMMKIVRLEALGKTFKFYLENGDVFEMLSGDVYSQPLVRKYYTLGTNKILPAISKASFDKFLLSLHPVAVEGEGLTLLERVEEILRKKYVYFEEDDLLLPEEEARARAHKRGFSGTKTHILFSSEGLLAELKKENPWLNKEQITSAIQDLCAERITYREARLWRYEMGDGYSAESFPGIEGVEDRGVSGVREELRDLQGHQGAGTRAESAPVEGDVSGVQQETGYGVSGGSSSDGDNGAVSVGGDAPLSSQKADEGGGIEDPFGEIARFMGEGERI